jgi:hypothetical protein
MHSYVSVSFRDQAPFRVDITNEEPQDRNQARQWLDTQFLTMECEPLRATGKLLMTDRVVVVAQAAGPDKFADTAWALEYANAVSAVLGKPVVNVDADALSITC